MNYPRHSASPAPPAINPLIPLYLGIFSIGVLLSASNTALPIIGRRLDLSEVEINLLVSIAAGTVFLTSPFWGRKSQRYGRGNIILVSLFGAPLAIVLFSIVYFLGVNQHVTDSVLYILLIIARMSMAICLAAIFPAAMAYVSDNTTISQRAGGFSKIGGANNIGTISGPVLAVLAGFSLLAPLFAAGILCLIAGAVVLKYFSAPLPQGARRNQPKLSYFDRRYRNYLLIGVSIYFAMSMCHQTMAYFIQDTFHLGDEKATQLFGLCLMSCSVSLIFFQMFVVPRLSLPPRTYLLLGLPLIPVAFIVFANVLTIPHLIFGMLMLGAGIGLASPGYTAGTSLKVEDNEQGAASGILAACPALGFVIGAPLGAVLYQTEHTLPYIVAALVFIPICILAWRTK